MSSGLMSVFRSQTGILSLILILVGISFASVFYFPENGLTILGVQVSRLAWKICVECIIFFFAYKLYTYHGGTAVKSKYIYFSSKRMMKAYVVRDYGNESMEFTSGYPCPKVVNPTDVLVRVRAASVNPIDYHITAGHARSTFDKLRREKQLPHDGAELPLVLGRDCSGVVEAIGSSVTKFQVGDEVYLSIGVADTPGTFAELVLAKEFMIAKKPRTLDHTRVASVPYVCTTTWAALVGQCHLGPNCTKGKRVLILGGTGGVGSFAIQLVKAWGGHVTTTCAPDGFDLVKNLGADDVIDYTTEDFEDALSQRQRFDVVFITLGPAHYQSSLRALKKGGCAVTIVVPFFANLKNHGKLIGTLMNTSLILKWKLEEIVFKRKFTFAFNYPNGSALQEVSRLMDEGKIHPVIHRVFDFESANEALASVKRGHARGKTVITIGVTDVRG